MRNERSKSGDRSADLLVIGGGVIGLACGWRTAAAGLTTLVLDAGPAERASDVAAGMIAPVGEARWGEEALLGAALASAASWPAFAAELERASSSEVPYRRCGAVHVALDRDEAAELRRLHDLHQRLRLPAGWLRASDCRRLEPGLATGVVGGLEAPEEAEIDPRALLTALRAALVASGGEIRPRARVEEILTAGRRAVGVRLEAGEAISAGCVLLANGARWGDRMLPDGMAGALPPIRPVKGQVVRLRAAREERPCERLVITERVYVVPRRGEEVVVGATAEERGFDLRVTAGGVHELLREAYRALPEIAELELIECSAGLRPATPDNAPVVGETGLAGLLAAGGHHRNGILLAPLTAESIRALLSGEVPPAEVGPLAPDRFGALAGEPVRA